MCLAKSILALTAFMFLTALFAQGCHAPTPVKNEPAQIPPSATPAEESSGANTPEGGSPPANPETPPAQEHFLKLISPAENAMDVDPKLPLEWSVDSSAGKVSMVNINIAEIGPDGKPSEIYCAVFIRGMDPAMTAKSKWTAFEADTDKNWMFTGDDYRQLKQLKPKTKYMLEIDVSLDNEKKDSVRRIFTTK